MKKTTQTKVVLEIEAQDLVKRFVECQCDIVKDTVEIEDIITVMEDFKGVLQLMVEGKWTVVFREGWTMVVLPDAESEYVENFFTDKRQKFLSSAETLELRITQGDKSWIVPEDDICF